jgi:hypothetical protein
MHNNKTIRKVATMLEGASKAHAGQAKMLRKVLANPMPKKSRVRRKSKARKT